MTLLCFLLDLRTIPPPLLGDLKKSLLELANYYAITHRRGEDYQNDEERRLRDLIGLCYIQRNRAPGCDEIKIAHSPIGNFNLRDFHLAVSHIPTDNYLNKPNYLDFPGSSDLDVAFSKLLSHESLYCWNGKDVLKKLVLISSYLVPINEALRNILMDVAEHCVSVEFVLLEQADSFDLTDKSETFLESISDLENCLLRRYLPDSWVLCCLVKRWLQELNGEPVQAIFVFKSNIAASRNQIHCNLFATSNQIFDSFIPCQVCRCHGKPISGSVASNSEMLFCPVTDRYLSDHEMIENAVKVGEHTILYLPSFRDIEKLPNVYAPNFTVIERINLASLDEGVILGAPYVVTPSTCNGTETVSEEYVDSDTNSQIFHALCISLSRLDQGFICSSNYNMETMKNALFKCFYVLQPSNRGFMLLRKVATLEEFLPVPVEMPSADMIVSDDMISSVHSSISDISLVDYNPLLHVRGFHSKLNSLVKESLRYGAIPEKKIDVCDECDSTLEFRDYAAPPSSTSEVQPQKDGFKDGMSNIAEEWEQLIMVKDLEENYAAPFAEPAVENQISSSSSKPVCEQTSRILERLEPPKQQKMLGISTSTNIIMKNPLLSLNLTASSELMRPNFQRLKRKKI